MKSQKTNAAPATAQEYSSEDLRTLIKKVVEAELDEAQALLEQCSLKKRAALVAKMGKMLIHRQSTEEAAAIEKGAKGAILTLNINGIVEDEETLRERIKGKEPTRIVKHGRPKGSLNKKTQQVTERLKIIFVSEFEYVTGKLDELSPEERLDFTLKLAPLVMPRLSSKDIDKSGLLEASELHMYLD